MEPNALCPQHRVAVEFALDDVGRLTYAHEELAGLEPCFTVPERGWIIAGVTVRAPSRAEARRIAAAVVMAALDVEPVFLWLH